MGVGFVNTLRLNDKWRLYAEVGYHFMASINSKQSSGTGHGSNGYAEINVGVEMDLSSVNSFYKSSGYFENEKDGVALNRFWDNWFIQAGLGMLLINPYNTDFKNVFPNGSTYGLNVGLGKWFTPEVGIRGGVNWQNGIIVNHHASYLEPKQDSEGDPNRHGIIYAYADMFFNLHQIIAGYNNAMRWNSIVFPRMGIARNFSSSFKECPVLGIGTEQIYKLNDCIKVYADLSYQVTTSGFLDSRFHTGNNSLNSNGWFDLNIGVQYELGQTRGWRKMTGAGIDDNGYHAPNATGHNWPRFAVNTIASVGVAYVGKTALKKMIKEERPDHSDNQSFPSGHASMAFAAARSIDKEFRKESIWIPIAGYAAATAVGVERVVSDRHHWYDVVAGGALGFGAAELTWWVSDMLLGKGNNLAVGWSGQAVDVSYRF